MPESPDENQKPRSTPHIVQKVLTVLTLVTLLTLGALAIAGVPRPVQDLVWAVAFAKMALMAAASTVWPVLTGDSLLPFVTLGITGRRIASLIAIVCFGYLAVEKATEALPQLL